MKRIIIYLFPLLFLTGCSTTAEPTITPQWAADNGHVVSDYGVIAHIDKLEAFITQTKLKTPATLKVTRFTKEGDPIFFTLQYDGTLIKVTKDATHDQFGGGVGVHECIGLKKEEKESEFVYSFTGCWNSSSTPELLVLPKNQ